MFQSISYFSFLYLFLVSVQINAADDLYDLYDAPADQKYKIEGWKLLREDENPPKDEDKFAKQYLMLSDKEDFAVKLTSPPESDLVDKFTGMSISMRLWARWSGNDVQKNVFEFAIMPCNISWPSTINPTFENGGKNWQPFEKKAENGPTGWNFNFEDCRNDFRIRYKVKQGQEDKNPLVAIKDLKIKYTYKKVLPTTEAPTEPSTEQTIQETTPDTEADKVLPTTEKPEATPKDGTAEEINESTVNPNEDRPDVENNRRKRNVVAADAEETDEFTKECSSADNCKEFMFLGQWSIEELPPFSKEQPSFRIPDTRFGVMNISIPVENATLDTCVPFNYWVTKNAKLVVGMESAKNTLVFGTTTATTKSKQYEWYQNRICISTFLENVKEGNYSLQMKSDISEEFLSKDVVAIDINVDQIKEQPKTETLDYLSSWKNAAEAEKEWHHLPLNVWKSKNEKELEYEVNLPTGSKGHAYLYSQWFKNDSDLKLRVTVKPDEKLTSAKVAALLMNGEYELISTTPILDANYDLDNTSTAEVTKEIAIENAKAKKGDGHLILFKVDYDTKDGSTNNVIKFSQIDLSDGCRDEDCSGNGICNRLGPNKKECICNKGYEGKKCENIDYCKYSNVNAEDGTRNEGKQDPTKFIDGVEFCKSRNGTCENTNSDFACKCEKRSYWNAIDKWCTQIGACDGVICGYGQICNPDNEQGNLCECDDGFDRQKDGSCVQINPCEAKNNPCGSADCENDNGKAQCYCKDVGFKYDSDKKICTPLQCSIFVKESLGCSQTCEFNKKQNAFVCSCFRGWKLDDSKKNCRIDFKPNITCPDDEHPIQHEDETEECVCREGFYRDSSKKCKVDFCKKAENEAELKNVIKSICGTDKCEVKNGKVACFCDGNYETDENSGLCKLKTPCLESITCAIKDSICIPDLSKKDKSYKCECPIGKMLTSDKKECVDQCESYKTCYFHNAECQRTYDRSENRKPSCKCLPGFYSYKTVNQNEFCEIAEKHHKLSFKAKYYTPPSKRTKRSVSVDCEKDASLDVSGCVDYVKKVSQHQEEVEKEINEEKKIEKDFYENIKNSFVSVFGPILESVAILSAKKDGDQYDLVVTAQFKKEFKDQISINNTLNNNAADLGNGYCFIPPGLVIEDCDIRETTLDFCTETAKEYCPSINKCDFENDLYSCHCKPGFKIKLIAPLSKDKKTGKEITREFCEDINECDSLCKGNNENCINLVGSYVCNCKHGYKRQNGECKELCGEIVNCQNGGTCKVLSNDTAACECAGGWKGFECTEEDDKARAWRSALITVTSILGVLLIIVIIGAIIMIKKRKRQSRGYNNNAVKREGPVNSHNSEHSQSNF